MIFTRMGWIFALIVGAYGVVDLAWTVFYQGALYNEAMRQQGVEGGEEMARFLKAAGWSDDIADAIRTIGFAVALGILSEIGKSVASRQFA